MQQAFKHFFLADKEGNGKLLLRITCLFWLLAKLIGWKVWLSNRLFPLVPPFDWLNGIPPFVHIVLFIVSLSCLVLLLFLPEKKTIGIVLLIAELMSCSLDQTRWQPWEYQYVLMLFLLLINRKNHTALFSALCFLLAVTYIYSGLGKLNTHFLDSVWSRMMLTRFFHAPSAFTQNSVVYYSGYTLAVIELLAGIGLLFRKTQALSAACLIAMHVFNLLLLGPLGLRYNIIVWPWNVVMILLLYLLFRSNASIQPNYRLLTAGFNKILFLVGILPALSFIGWWDYYLSFNLYTGATPKMIICIGDSTEARNLMPYQSKKISAKCKGVVSVNIQNWAFAEMRVPPYPEKRVYRIIEKKLQQQYPLAGIQTVVYTSMKDSLSEK